MPTVNNSFATTLDQTALDAIAAGRSEDIFAVLGSHADCAGKGLVIRAFLPWANSVEVIDSATGSSIAALNKVHHGGVFEVVVANRQMPFAYHFLVNGAQRVDDPYRFPPSLSDDNLYLFTLSQQFDNAAYQYRWQIEVRSINNELLLSTWH